MVTSLEQSKHLAELGYSTSRVDMYWHPGYMNVPDQLKRYRYKNVAAYSLGTLLDSIPQTILNDEGEEYTFQMGKDDDFTYVFGYDADNNSRIVEFVSEDALDAAYEIVCWLLENKYIK